MWKKSTKSSSVHQRDGQFQQKRWKIMLIKTITTFIPFVLSSCSDMRKITKFKGTSNKESPIIFSKGKMTFLACNSLTKDIFPKITQFTNFRNVKKTVSRTIKQTDFMKFDCSWFLISFMFQNMNHALNFKIKFNCIFIISPFILFLFFIKQWKFSQVALRARQDLTAKPAEQESL